MKFHLIARAQLHTELQRIEVEKVGLSHKHNTSQLASLDKEILSILNYLNNINKGSL